jgi:hypothetical protein
MWLIYQIKYPKVLDEDVVLHLIVKKPWLIVVLDDTQQIVYYIYTFINLFWSPKILCESLPPVERSDSIKIVIPIPHKKIVIHNSSRYKTISNSFFQVIVFNKFIYLSIVSWKVDVRIIHASKIEKWSKFSSSNKKNHSCKLKLCKNVRGTIWRDNFFEY